MAFFILLELNRDIRLQTILIKYLPDTSDRKPTKIYPENKKRYYSLKKTLQKDVTIVKETSSTFCNTTYKTHFQRASCKLTAITPKKIFFN